VVPRRHIERFAQTAAETVEIVAPLASSEVATALEHWVNLADDLAQREAAEAAASGETGDVIVSPVPEREVALSRSLDDTRVLNGTLDPDSGAYLEAALHAATVADIEGERRTPMQRRADALVEICRFYLAHHLNPPNAARPDRLVLTADVTTTFRAVLRGAGVMTAAQLQQFLADRPGMGKLERGLFLDAFDANRGPARTLDGTAVTDTLLAHVTANGLLERLLTADGRILDHGRSIRVFTDTQRRAILARDQGCRVEGCDTGPERCDIHHVNPFDDGGTTDIANGIAKCRRDHLHHHRQHRTDHLKPDGTYTITHPTGLTLTTRPPGWTEPLPTLTVHTTSDPAPELPYDDQPPPPERRRPRCDCPCDEHRSPEEETEFQQHRRVVLDRFRHAA
jgi:hypothetical protein